MWIAWCMVCILSIIKGGSSAKEEADLMCFVIDIWQNLENTNFTYKVGEISFSLDFLNLIDDNRDR